MGYDAPDRRSFNERVAADRQATLDRQAASDNWLSAVLVEVEQEQENSAERRASIAFHKRASRRYSTFVTKAKTEAEFESRVAVIEDGLRETATEVAREYGATNADDLYTGARTAAGDFFYDSNPWGPGGAVADQQQQAQTEVCPHCKMTKPVGGACPNCGFNAPASAGTGAELGGLQQRMNSVKESHPNCKGEGCKFCENKGKMGQPDKGADSAEGEKYHDEMDDREEGSDDDDDDDKKTASPGDACAGCGTKGNVVTDSDGVKRCNACSKANFDKKASLKTAYHGDDEQDGLQCPMCGGPGVPLGQLGSRSHFRCRNCGTDFSDDQAAGAQQPQGNYPQVGDERGPDAGMYGSVRQRLAMAVSKKDFVAISEILKQNGADPGLAQQIADYFQTQNQNFDNDRFMDAAGAGAAQQPQGNYPQVGDESGPDFNMQGSVRTAGIHSASEDMWHADSIHEAAGADLRGDKYQYKRVSPDAEIGPGSIADGPSYPTDTVEEVLKGSKDHPSERREVLDFDAAENTDPKIKRKVDDQNLGGDNPYKEQTGSGQGGTFGDSHGVTEAVTTAEGDSKLGSISKWHVL